MKRIGIISENYNNDSKAVAYLLKKRFGKQATFIPLLKSISGKGLEEIRKVAAILKTEISKNSIDLLILVRDLDALISDKKEIKRVENWAQTIKKKLTTDQKLFIVIFELEALILADINTFNGVYKTKYQLKTSPKFQSEPKELLKQITRKTKRKYKESDTPEIFQQLNFQKVYQNHKGENSFQSFIDELTTILN